jgi:dihydroxy-acid dehydratase
MKKNLESPNFSINILSAAPDQKIVRSVDNPIHKEGTLKILSGSLAPDGAVM